MTWLSGSHLFVQHVSAPASSNSPMGQEGLTPQSCLCFAIQLCNPQGVGHCSVHFSLFFFGVHTNGKTFFPINRRHEEKHGLKKTILFNLWSIIFNLATFRRDFCLVRRCWLKVTLQFFPLFSACGSSMAYIGAIASCSLKRKNDSTTRLTMNLLRTFFHSTIIFEKKKGFL